MLFKPDIEPHIIDQRGGVVAVFKPQGWHSTPQAQGHGQEAESIVSWMSKQGRELPSCELVDAIGAMQSGLNRDSSAAGSASSSLNTGSKPNVQDRFAVELGMLYRLDFATSGIMLFALSRSVFERMLYAQAKSALEKRYASVCTESNVEVPGSLPVSRLSERASLLEDIRAGRERRIASYFRGYGARGARVACVAPEYFLRVHKKTAKSLYETRYVRCWTADADESTQLVPEWSMYARAIDNPILIDVRIRKGFRHQIRAHSAWMGLPIAGDPIYGGVPMNRLMLEAYSVVLMEGNDILHEWSLFS